MNINLGHFHDLLSTIDLNNDVIHLNYDSADDAIFRGIRLRFSNETAGVIELFNSENGFNNQEGRNEKVKY